MKKTAPLFNFSPKTYYRDTNYLQVLTTTPQVVRHTQQNADNIQQLRTAAPRLVRLRDGEVVLFRLPTSSKWHIRYKLKSENTHSGEWVRVSSRTAVLEDAKRKACELYDEARYRQRLGLAPVMKRYADIAAACVADMREEQANGHGKAIYKDYINCIEKYLVPYFGNHHLTTLTAQHIAEFEQWRDDVMGKRAKSSTLVTFASAYNRIHETAIQRGWISDKVPVPKLSVRGEKGKPRDAFSVEQIAQLREFLAEWHTGGNTDKSKQTRRILRDTVDVLYLTGMRVGTETNGLEWQHIEWHTEKSVRYLRVWVSGKTGPRWLIGKHELLHTLNRIRLEHEDTADLDLDALLAAKLPLKLLRYKDGTQPINNNHTFKAALTAAGIGQRGARNSLTLYSIRHTYATTELLSGTDIHTLAKQMGTSVVMLEQHYSKLTATMAAGKLA